VIRIGLVVILHSSPVPETDLKPDNVLFNEGNTPQTIKALLDQSPQVIDGEFELKGACYPIMRSQPIPHPFKRSGPGITAELYSVCMTDFGSGKHYLSSSISITGSQMVYYSAISR
jgi:serine/threonine-protein kinase SRPK3